MALDLRGAVFLQSAYRSRSAPFGLILYAGHPWRHVLQIAHQQPRYTYGAQLDIFPRLVIYIWFLFQT